MKIIEKVNRTFWEDVAKNCIYATFFHTPYWADLIGKTFVCQDVTRGFLFEDGTRAVLPLMKRKTSFIRTSDDYISGIPYVYGGPIAEKALRKEQFAEIIEYVNATFKRYNTILIRGNPFTANFPLKGYQEVKDCSHVSELYKYKDEENLFKSYSPRYRTYIKRAIESNSLVVKEAITSNEYDLLYTLYQQSIRHWDKSLTNYPLALLRNVYNLKNNHIKLWAVYCEDIMIGGDIILYWNDHCCMWLSYHNRNYSHLHARRYLIHNISLDGIKKGIKLYDFLQSGGIKGVEKFKRSLGGKEYLHQAWIKESLLSKKIKQVKSTLHSFINQK